MSSSGAGAALWFKTNPGPPKMRAKSLNKTLKQKFGPKLKQFSEPLRAKGQKRGSQSILDCHANHNHRSFHDNCTERRGNKETSRDRW